jgi:hypothetical protein
MPLLPSAALPWRWLLALGLLLLPRAVGAKEMYFVIIFASQRGPHEPKYTHSFATFVKTTGDGCCPESYCLESHTISWLPTSLDICVWRLLPDRGANFDLQTTLCWALGQGQRVSRWGLCQVQKELYDQALCQLGHLSRGTVRYKAIDSGYPTAWASNCIHAVSDVAGTFRLRVASPWYGEVASYLIALRFKRWRLCPDVVHEWVAEALGLDCYPIICRDLHRPGILPRWHSPAAGRSPHN